jgi:ATP phosphoribosyltransferase
MNIRTNTSSLSAGRTQARTGLSDGPVPSTEVPLRLGLPKGRMQDEVLRLLSEAGLTVTTGDRSYRAAITWPSCNVKLLKPQNIVEMLQAGSRDLGFAGADWVAEKNADLVEVLDTGLNPVRVVAAAPTSLLENGRLPRRPMVVATEYVELTRGWLNEAGLDAQVVRSFGATEVFPPEDADFIVDNTATGSTLVANGLEIIDQVMTSSTRLYASKAAWNNGQRARIEEVAMLLDSVLEARRRIILEVNVSRKDLPTLAAILPAMREPTISELNGKAGFAVKVAVPRRDLALLVPRIKQAGGSDIIITEPSQIVP